MRFLLLALLGLAGCGTSHLEGRWVGAVPLTDATNCRIRLMKSKVFEMVCSPPGAWAGAGEYASADGRLTLTFKALTKDQQKVTDLPTPIVLRLNAEGNVLRLTDESGREYVWERRFE